MRGFGLNVPAKPSFSAMCLQDNLVDCADSGGLTMCMELKCIYQGLAKWLNFGVLVRRVTKTLLGDIVWIYVLLHISKYSLFVSSICKIKRIED